MPENLEKILKSFLNHLNRLKIPYALIGGLAVGYWSEERFTKDIDLTIALSEKSWTKLKGFLENSSEIKIDSINKDADSELPYLIRLQFKKYPFDLIVSLTEFQSSLISRSIKISFLGSKLKIASPEDIVISKLLAWRSQDRVDLEKIVKGVSDLDFSYIEKWAKVWEIEDRWKEIKQG
jgi:hypothetical protein